MPEPVFVKTGTYIIAREPISTVYSINPCSHSACLCVFFLALLFNGSVNTFSWQRIHGTTKELLDASFAVRAVSYQGSLWISVPLSLLGNNSVKRFPRRRKIVRGAFFYAVSVISKESRHLVLPRTSCLFSSVCWLFLCFFFIEQFYVCHICPASIYFSTYIPFAYQCFFIFTLFFLLVSLISPSFRNIFAPLLLLVQIPYFCLSSYLSKLTYNYFAERSVLNPHVFHTKKKRNLAQFYIYTRTSRAVTALQTFASCVKNIILWHEDRLLGKNRERKRYTTAVTEQRLRI
jgi:hypothetical protein